MELGDPGLPHVAVEMAGLQDCDRQQLRELGRKLRFYEGYPKGANVDTRQGKDLLGTFIADLVLQILSFAAENERNNIKSRQAQGIEAAKKRGVKFGRPKITPPEDFNVLVAQWRNGTLKLSDLLVQCNMSESTFYRKIKKS